MLDKKHINLLAQAIQNRSLLELKQILNKIPEEDAPEACSRVAVYMCPPSKRYKSRFNLEKLEELWLAVGIKEECVNLVVKELAKLLEDGVK